MWCPRCGSEYRDGIVRCEGCGVDLVAEEPEPEYSLATGPLTGRPIDEEMDATGPALVGAYAGLEEAQSIVRILADAGIPADILQRDDQFPKTVAGHSKGVGVAVAGPLLPRARQVLRAMEPPTVAVARFRREEQARSAMALLESKGLAPTLMTIMLDEVPPEVREEMDPYVVDVPAAQEAAALEALESLLIPCAVCGAPLQQSDDTCPTCGKKVAV